MRIQFKRFRLISSKKRYSLDFVKTKEVWMIRGNTPKWLWGFGIVFNTPEK
jgi:hypothetical protein